MIIKLNKDELKEEIERIKQSGEFGDEVKKLKSQFELPAKANKLFAIKMVSEDELKEIQGLCYMYTFTTAKGTFGNLSLLVVPKKFYKNEFLNVLLYHIEKIAKEEFALSGIISTCNDYNELAFTTSGYKEIGRKYAADGKVKQVKFQKFL